jgi:hypothetical protein
MASRSTSGVVVGDTKRSVPQGSDRTERWLGPDDSCRSRGWAYEELLFGKEGSTRATEALSSLAADLAVDLAELRRMQNQLLDHVVRIAELEGRVAALIETTGPVADEQPELRVAADAGMRSFPSDPIRPGTASERGSALARCEGFQVDSPHGLVGFVEGLRFGSRIDQPDLLEVRGGRFGRQLLLIPIEAIEEISPADERLVVRNAAESSDDPLHELVGRLRDALHHVVS